MHVYCVSVLPFIDDRAWVALAPSLPTHISHRTGSRLGQEQDIPPIHLLLRHHLPQALQSEAILEPLHGESQLRAVDRLTILKHEKQQH